MVCRLLLNVYNNHVTGIAWNGILYCNCGVFNGVRQGGVLSPVLFCGTFGMTALKTFVMRGVRVLGGFGPPQNARNQLLPNLCNEMPIIDEVCFISIGFFSSYLRSNCSVVNVVAH